MTDTTLTEMDKALRDASDEDFETPDVAPEPEQTPEPEAKKDEGPKRIKHRLSSRDVKKFARILGRIREMATKRGQLRAKMQQDGIDDEEELPVMVDMWTMLMTDGLDYAEKEINLWFAKLCEIELDTEEVEEWRAMRAKSTGQQDYKLSTFDREDALNEKIANMDVAFYSDVITDLQRHGGLGDFLTALNALGESMNSARGQ